LYLVRLKSADIPTPPDWPRLSSSVDAVMAAPDARQLYIKVDYYRDTVDESTNTRTGTEPYGSVIWILNVEDGQYIANVKLPFFETSVTENRQSENVRLLYSLLGVLKNGKVLLYSPSEEGYSVMFFNTISQERLRAFIKIDSSALQLNIFDLSAEGLLSAMLVNDFKLTMAWWRTDKFIGEMQ
jgi:hypothetical protein